MNVDPPRRDLVAERMLNTKEIDTLMMLIHASQPYDGGATGTGGATIEGPWETLAVFCCDRRDIVVLVTSGNQTFKVGSDRHRLLQQLYDWQAELTKSAEQKLRH